MAEVVTRFKLETSQFDSKLRDAASGLSKFANEAQIAGKSFDGFSKESVDAAKALGTISTSATSAKGKVSELVGAFNAAARAYNDLTKEEQQSEWGKALSSSLETLKGRISEAKSELYGLNNTSRDTGGVMGMLKEKLSINIDAIKLFNIGLKAAEGALSVAKDAFFASEQNLDDWQRTLYTAKSTYEGFLTSINTGDISGFLTRIDDIVRASSAAYNAMDALSTQKAINNPAVQAQQAENQRFRTMLMTHRYIAPSDGRSTGGLVNGQLLSDTQVRVIERMLENGMKTLTSYTQKEISATTKAIEALYDEQATRLGMTKGQFMAGTKNYDVFAYNVEMANKYRDFESRRRYAQSLANSGQNLTQEQASILSAKNPYAAYRAWGVFKDDGELFNTINAKINQRAGLQSQLYGQYGQTYRTINRVEGISTRIGGGGGGGTGGGAGGEEKMLVGGIANLGAMNMEVEGTTQSMRDLQAALQYFQNMLATATTTEQYNTAQAGISATKATIAVQPDALKYGLSTDMMADIENTMNIAIEDMQKRLKPVEIKMSASKSLVADGEKLVSAYTAAANAVSSVGSALQGIEDPGAKVAGIIAQAIANIALSFAGSLKGTFTPWDWIAAAAAGTATMVSTIAAIKSATAGSYEEGGIVPGNSYHGDHLLAAVNSQELILSKAQSDNIASLLVAGENGGGGGSSRPYVSGEQIYLGMTNYLRRSGRGEIVTTR